MHTQQPQSATVCGLPRFQAERSLRQCRLDDPDSMKLYFGYARVGRAAL
jgi:hypothetical protein